MSRWTSVIAIGLVLAVAAPASAATPIDLGPGRGPSVTVDPAGTAHILFGSAGGATYCRLPRNARACDVRTFMPLAESTDEARIFRRASDGALIAVQTDDLFRPSGGTGALWASYSVDNGATFSPPVALAYGAHNFDAISLSADGQALVNVRHDVGGLFLRRAPFAAPDPRVMNVDDTANSASEGTLTVLPDGRMLTAQETLSNVGWRVFTGGDPLDIDAWPKRGTLRSQNSPVLVSGPRGVFLLDHRPLSEQLLDKAAPFGVRAFDTKRLRWRAARTAGADETIFGTSSLFEDPAGRLHLIATHSRANKAACVLYTRTGTRSSQWFGRTTILFRTRAKEREPHDPVVAAGAGGRGVAAWDDRRGPTGSEGNVWATALRQATGRYRPVSNPFKRLDCGRR